MMIENRQEQAISNGKSKTELNFKHLRFYKALFQKTIAIKILTGIIKNRRCIYKFQTCNILSWFSESYT